MALKIAVHYILVFLIHYCCLWDHRCDPFRDNIQYHTNHILCGYIFRFILF